MIMQRFKPRWRAKLSATPYIISFLSIVIVSPFLEFHQLVKRDQNSRASEQVTKRWINVCLSPQRWHLSCSLIESLKSVEFVGKTWWIILYWKRSSLVSVVTLLNARLYISRIVCSFRPASVILRSAVGVTNLLLTKNLVADLQESLSKDILSFSERFSKASVKFPLRILIHFGGTAWHKP